MSGMTLEFEGKQELVKRLDGVMDGDCARTITACVRNVLCDLVDNRVLALPACVHECPGDHYGRRLIHKDQQRGYTVMAMTWGPGQATPIHDHSGMWCVEAVWQGEIEGVGSAGSLIPPHEYHTIANPSPHSTAVTIHIYSGEMTECCVFRPIEGDWYERSRTELHLDAA